MNHLFRLVKPVLDRNVFIFKVSVFMKRARYECLNSVDSPDVSSAATKHTTQVKREG